MTAAARELVETTRRGERSPVEVVDEAVAAELEQALGGALDPAESPRSALSRSA